MSKKIIIIAAASLLLVGGGVGGYFYFMKPAEASVSDEDKKTVEEDKKEEGEHEAVLEFVKLDPLVLPIIDNEGVNQVLSLVVSLEVASVADGEKVKNMSPRLKDAYIRDMYGVLNKNSALKGGVVQVNIIKERLNKVSDKVMGDSEIVRDVLLQVVQQRPI